MIDYADLIGLPFRYGGRGPDAYDCYGLLMEAYRRRGVLLPDFQSDTRQPVNAMVMRSNLWRWKRVEARPGVGVMLSIRGMGSHVGFVVDEFNFIHAWEGSKEVLRERLSLWERKTLGFYDYIAGGPVPTPPFINNT